ncbi:hypothetical protein MHC_01305 [Mycoplasma haemocanis str. Illinois]|uniref:Uncharacterized protein n=1 Tax=Mycoplasma haemocanis (strain Illinois) TaxID=1111676 RepID=H6N655_MYCHN|nr:hypothetical protein [Mycoplasma haemocanis]AEW45127.1 hypothetical protein MHC_01305 [Mycoplasma haemocanis str. Illinois]
MTHLAKVVSATAVIGTAVTGGIYLGTDFFKDKKVEIAVLLKTSHPNKRLITSKSVSDDSWKKAYKAYREANKDKIKDIWNLKDWTKPSATVDETNATDDFISKCNSNSKLEVDGSSDPLYEQVLAYCTRDTLVSDLISEYGKGKRLLSKDGSDQEDAWKAAWNIYKTQNKDKEENQDPWKLSEWKNKKSGNELPNDYKDKCVEYSQKPAYQLENENYKNVLDWCTV